MKPRRSHFSFLLAWSLLLLLLAGLTSVQGQFFFHDIDMFGPGYRIQNMEEGFRCFDRAPFHTDKQYYLYRSKGSEGAEDTKLNLYIHQGEFQLFISRHHPKLNRNDSLWSETLKSSDPDKMIDLKKLNVENGKYFYIYLESLQQNDDSSIRDQDDDARMRNSPRYSLSVTESLGLVLKEDVNQSALIQSHELGSFFYHSTQDGLPLKISVEYAPANPENYPGESFEASLNQGLQFRGEYWDDFRYAGIWSEVWLGVQAQAIKGENSFSQTFLVTGEKRKYRLQIKNPWSFEIKMTIKVSSSETSYFTLEPNSQHYGVLSSDGRSERYEFSPGQTGKWYLWSHSCTGTVDLKLKDEDVAPGWGYDISQTLQQGENFAHEVRIWNKGLVDRPKYLTISKNSDEKKDDAGVLVTFTSINPESHFGEHESVVNIERTKVTYGKNTQMTVPVQTRNYPGAEATDEIRYDVRLCPYNSSHPEDEKNFCKVREECLNYTEEFMIHEQKQVTATFDNVTDGTYYVQVLATIFHGGQMVKFEKEEVERITVQVPFGAKVRNNWEKILIGFIVLMILIVVTVKGYKKLKAMNEEKGFAEEMNRRGYGVVGDA